MKVVRKFKIIHNKKLFWIIIGLVILLAIVIGTIIKDGGKINEVIKGDLCIQDSDCVPATCCHPTECVIKEKTPDCSSMFCSTVCSGPLDCGAGNCGCVNNKCEVIPANNG